jgi:hypothetical protein
MEAVEFHRICRKIFKRGFSRDVFNGWLPGTHRMQQLGSNLEMKRICEPDNGVAHRLGMVRAQKLSRRGECKMPWLGFRKNTGHCQQAQHAEERVFVGVGFLCQFRNRL